MLSTHNAVLPLSIPVMTSEFLAPKIKRKKKSHIVVFNQETPVGSVSVQSPVQMNFYFCELAPSLSEDFS